MEAAEEHADKLALLQPDHPVIRLTYGFVALKRSNLDEADRQVDPLLQASPREPTANQLKARILVARGKRDDAVRLLEAQTSGKPDDAGAWKALMGLQLAESELARCSACCQPPGEPEARGPGAGAHRDRRGIPAQRHPLRPARLGTVPSAGCILGRCRRRPDDLGRALEVTRGSRRSEEAESEPRPSEHRLAYATYFNMAGSPDDAAALLGGAAAMAAHRRQHELELVDCRDARRCGDSTGRPSGYSTRCSPRSPIMFMRYEVGLTWK